MAGGCDIHPQWNGFTCFPSLFKEGFGLVLLEAVALGVRVVAYSTGGVPEALEDAPGSILVEKGNINAFANAVLSVFKQGLTQKTDGFAFVQRKFNISQTAEQIENIYQQLLKIKGPKSSL